MRPAHTTLALLVLTIPFHPDTARAEGDVAAAACVPDGVTVAEEKFQSSSGSYSFYLDNTGVLAFTCPVTLDPGNYRLNLSYANDADGAAIADQYVKAEWRRVNKSTGVASTLCSDHSRSTAAETRWMCPEQYFTVNSNYWYFVRVVLYRDPGKQPPLHSIRFDGISFVKQ